MKKEPAKAPMPRAQYLSAFLPATGRICFFAYFIACRFTMGMCILAACFTYFIPKGLSRVASWVAKFLACFKAKDLSPAPRCLRRRLRPHPIMIITWG